MSQLTEEALKTLRLGRRMSVAAGAWSFCAVAWLTADLPVARTVSAVAVGVAIWSALRAVGCFIAVAGVLAAGRR